MSTKLKGANSGILIDWRDKQLVQDIEAHNASPLDVSLELCTFWNKSVYGSSKSDKDKVNREYWSNKIQTLKRRERKGTYHKFVVECEVTPSARTVAAHQAFLAGIKIRPDEVQTPPASPKSTSSSHKSSQKSSPEPEPEPEPESGAAPAPKSARATSRSRASTTRSTARQKSLTPPRRCQLSQPSGPPASLRIPAMSSSNNMSDNDGLSVMSASEVAATVGEPYGSLHNPEICVFIKGREGRYANGYHVYQPPKMVVELKAARQKSRGFPGIFIMKGAHPASINKYTASHVTREYLDRLHDYKRITEDQSVTHSGILFKCPSCESGDRVGKSAVIPHNFPCQETYEHVKTQQAKVPNETWHHTLILFEEEFDNRVFSVDDWKIDRHFSCPGPEKLKELGNITVSHFHVFWRVAFRGQGFLLDEEEEDEVAEIVKKFQSNGTVW